MAGSKCIMLMLFMLSSEVIIADEEPGSSVNKTRPLTRSHHLVTRSGIRYCGQNLVKALRLLCNGAYAEPALKRSADWTSSTHFNIKHLIWNKMYKIKDKDTITWTELAAQYDALFAGELHHKLKFDKFQFDRPMKMKMKKIEKQKANKNRQLLKRKTRGIYDECCAKPCTVSYMKTYCLNSLIN